MSTNNIKFPTVGNLEKLMQLKEHLETCLARVHPADIEAGMMLEDQLRLV